MTMLSCRQYETRMHVAMMIDAYVNHRYGTEFKPCTPGNTLQRWFPDHQTPEPVGSHYAGQMAYVHEYTRIWNHIGVVYHLLKWDKFADYEIDRDWSHARQHGMKIDGVDVPATAFVAAQLRWERNGWLRYEFKRSKRRAFAAPFLRVAAIV